ncbi:autotransporter outer membrane beta-barrel domain-containing protein [Brucella intermedia]|nr:autotransporter outer membrane beta-barrel domain-containing protein [Brucella intermedia]
MMQRTSRGAAQTGLNKADKSARTDRWASQRCLRGGRMTKWKGQVASYAPHATQLVAFMGRAMLLPMALSTGLAAGPAMAGDLYWDADNSGNNLGGTGTWNTSQPLWNTTGNPVAGPWTTWNNANLDNAIFSGTAGTVTLGVPITAHNLSFLVGGGYTITGGTLTLAGASPTVNVISGAGVTINSVIAGSAGLTKEGGGLLSLGGANTFSGDINVNTGTLTVGSAGALGNLGNVVKLAEGVRLNSEFSLGGRTINLTGTQSVVAGAGVGSALFTGTGGIGVLAGVTMANDASDFTGQTTLIVNGNASFTSVRNAGQASSLGAGGTIIFNASQSFADSISYMGAGDTSDRDWQINVSGGSTGGYIRNRGSGTLTLSGDIAANGGIGFIADSGDLDLQGAISGPMAVSFTGGTGRTISVGGANTYTGATIIGNGGTIAGVAIGGGLTVRASSLADTGLNSSFGTGTGGGITIVRGATLSYTGGGASSNRDWTIGTSGQGPGGIIQNDGTGALSLSGGVSFWPLANNSLTLGGSYTGAANTISGVISGAGDLISNGPATWALSGANTRTGAVIVNGGTLRADSATAFGTITGVSVNGGTLDLNGFDLTIPTLNGTGGTLALGSADLTVDVATGVSNSYAGSITGIGGLTKRGAGTLTLSGANGYTGATTVNGGALALNFAGASAPANDIINSASTLVMNGGTLAVTGAVGATNSQTFDGLDILAGNNTISATSGAGGSLTLNLGGITRTNGLANFVQPTSGNIRTTNADGALGGWATVNGTDYAKVLSGGIIAFTAADYVNKDDASTWLDGEILSDAGGTANSAYFGAVSGSKRIGGLQYTAAANSVVTVGSGNTLGVDGTIIVAPSVGGANQTITGGSMTGTLGGGVLGVQQNGGGTFTIDSAIVDNTGTIGFTKAGTGRLALTGANTYTGATTIAQGTLAINSIGQSGQASSLGASSADASNLVIQGSTLQYTGASGSTDRGFTLARSGAITAGTISVALSTTNLTFSGEVLSPDAAGLTKTGLGTLTLSNANNSYNGVTTVTGGTLAVSTLANGSANSSIGNSTNDAANLVLQTGGTLNYLGGTTSTDRGFTLASGTGGIGVDNAGTTLTVSGTATGAGSLNKTGAGILILSGANNHTGGTTVSAGTLQAGSASAFGTGPMSVATDATLNLAGYSNTVGGFSGSGNVNLGTARLTINGNGSTFTGKIGGAGGVTLASGSEAFTGCGNDYTGSTMLQGGSTLTVGCLANGGQSSDIGSSSNASTNLVFNQGALNYTGGTTTTDRGFQLLANTGAIGVANAATTLTFTGQVIGGGLLRKDGPGTLVLSGNNTYTASTVVNVGTLRAGSTSAFGTSGVTVNPGATLDLNNFSNTVAALNGAGNVTLGSATLTTSGGNFTFSGGISGTGSLVKIGGSPQGLSGCNNSYTGGTTINGGILSVNCLVNGGVNSSIGASSAAPSNLVLNGGTLQYVGTGDSTDRQFTLGTGGGALSASGSGAINFTSTAPVTLSGSDNRTFTLTGTNTGNNSLSAQLDNPTSGTTSLTKTGTGTWILKNPGSTYTGITTIAGGVLGVDKLSNGGVVSSIGMSSSAASNLVIGSGSTLRYTGTGDTTDRLFTLSTGISVIEASGTGAVVFSNTGSASYQGNGNRTLALGGTNTGLNTMGGTIIDGPGGVTTLAKNDSGTWVLTGNNTFTGNTVVNDGNLIIGNGGISGNAGAGNVIVANASSTLSVNRSDTFAFAGTLSGPGTLAQIGNGTTRLTASGNQIGATAVSAGTLQVDGGLVTPTLAMTGTSTLTVNGTVGGIGVPAAITGDGSSNVINVNSGGMLTATGDLGGGSDVVTLAGTLNTGVGVLGLGAGNDTFALDDGAVLNGSIDGGSGGESGKGDTLQVNTIAGRTLAGSSVTSFETLAKAGAGTLTLTGNHSYTAGTTIAAGTLQIGDGTTSGALTTPTVANDGTLAFNLNNTYAFSGAISGSGMVDQIGTGTTTLTGTNSYTGRTNVSAGTLLINGDQSAATGLTTVASGATLGGIGVIGGDVIVADGATLSPGGAGNVPGTLAVNGNLTLGDSNLNVNFGQAGVVGGPLNDLIDVGGDLVLDGTLNVTQTPGGTFGPGIYRIFNYGGTLADNGLAVTDPDYFLQTSVDKQVNLVNSTGLRLSFWDGQAGPHSNGVINGGDGIWRAATDQNWTDSTGTFAAPFANASFAVFQGTAGTVGVNNANGQVQAVGMQFATNGYLVNGAALELVDDAAQAGVQSIIRVGDGTAAGAGYVATIASDIFGNTQLVKTDLGTLVLSGANTYTSGTAINGGTLQISADVNLGAIGGALSLDGGTLRNTASIVSSRIVTINAAGGTFDTLADLTLNGTIGGAGALTKTGAATVVLAGANAYQGGTIINDGTVQVSDNTNLGTASGGLTLDDGTLHTTGTFAAARNVTLKAGGGTFETDNLTTLTLANAIGGVGALTKDGAGTLVLSAANNYAGGTTIEKGTLQLGAGGATGSIVGDVTNNSNLAFNRSDVYTFAGMISGSGGVEQIGSGVTILTADNTYAGATNVREGTLLVNGNQSAAAGLTTVEDGGVLGGIGTVGGDVVVQDGGALNPGNPGAVPGTLTINGDLALGANATLNYNFGQAGVIGGAYNDLTVVHGDLQLDGTINVAETPGGNFGPGIYRIISYDGTLNDLGLSESSPNHVVQTSVAGQVNLVDISNLTLNFWDGDAGPKDNDLVNGGNGTWRAAGDDYWTDDTGGINAAFSNGSFAIFAGQAGTVDVDNNNGQVSASGMQFAASGYLIQGGAISLAGPQSTIRVGDGTAPGAAYVATIGSVLQGDTQLVKRDLGTLVLAGNNTYTGGTLITEGTLQISSNTNLGDLSGNLALSGGTLLNTAAITTSRNVTLNAGGGTFQTDTDLAISGLVTGTGGFAKTGTAALTLTGANSYAGPTTISAGALYVDGDQSAATGLTSVESGATLGGAGKIGGNVIVADGGVLNPGASNAMPGTLAIGGNLALSSGSVLNYRFGEANVAGGALNDLVTVGGNLVLDGTLNVVETPGGTFGPGIYRIFNYNGTLTNNGLTVGAIPSSNYFVQTAVAHQVNLVNTAGLMLSYWDGDAGAKFDGVINGGSGVWQGSAGNNNWTDTSGAINAVYANGTFPIFAGSAGTVTVDNSLAQVTAAGMQFAVNGYVISGENILLEGPASTIRVGDGTAASAGMKATIAAALTGNTQLIKTDLGTLELSGSNSYTGGTAINGGTLQVSSDLNLGDVSGSLSFDGGTLRNTASFASGRDVNVNGGGGTFETEANLALFGVIGGTGSLTKAGSGVLTLSGDSSSFAGSISIAAGTLSVSGSLCGDVNVLAGGRLEGTGTVCDTNNAGVVAPGIGGIGTFTVNGTYTGNNGVLEIETVLGGDSSRSDRLVVTGDTAGNTTIKVANVGGGGAPTVEGLQIIDIGGASNGAFTLAGDYLFQGEQAVVGGAYAYRLYKGGVSTPADGDWYLRSTYINPSDPAPRPLYAPGTPLYEAYAGVLQSFNQLGTLQQRLGNRVWRASATPQGADVPEAGPVDGNAIWARIEAAHSEFDPKTSTTDTSYDVTTWRLQAGVDGLLYENAAGVLIGGLTAQYGTASSSISSIFGGGVIDTTGYGFGSTLTWYGNGGFYLDAQGQAIWYDSDLTSSALGSLIEGNNGFGYALSLEGGQKVALSERWSLTPQAQLSYSSVRFDSFTDPFDAAVSLADGDSLVGRIGVSTDYEDQWVNGTGQVSRTHLYGIANLYYDFLDGSKVDVSGTRLISENQPLWGGLGAGGSLSWADGRYALHGEAFARTSLEDFGDSNELGAKFGFRTKW